MKLTNYEGLRAGRRIGLCLIALLLGMAPVRDGAGAGSEHDDGAGDGVSGERPAGRGDTGDELAGVYDGGGPGGGGGQDDGDDCAGWVCEREPRAESWARRRRESTTPPFIT